MMAQVFGFRPWNNQELLASAWPGPGYFSHFGSESEHGRFSLSCPFAFHTTPLEKQKPLLSVARELTA